MTFARNHMGSRPNTSSTYTQVLNSEMFTCDNGSVNLKYIGTQDQCQHKDLFIF